MSQVLRKARGECQARRGHSSSTTTEKEICFCCRVPPAPSQITFADIARERRPIRDCKTRLTQHAGDIGHNTITKNTISVSYDITFVPRLRFAIDWVPI